MNRTVTTKEIEFDMLESKWNRDVRERAGEIMRERNCSPEDALSEAGLDVARCRKLEAINRRLERDVADMRAKLEQERAACETPDAQRRNERQRIIDSLPDCPFCGSRPVWHAHAISNGWVKCSGLDCRNRDAWYRPDQWRARETKHAVQKVAYTAVVTSVNESAKETGITRYAECYAETGEDHNGWPLRAKVNVGINVDVNDRLRITVEKVGES